MHNSRALIGAAGAASVALAAGLVLPADAYLALVASLFVLVAAAVALIVQLGNPFLGLALLIVTAVAFPFEFRGPAGVMMSSSFPLTAVLCGIWLLSAVIDRRSEGLDTSRVVYAVLGLMSVTLLSFAVGQFPWFSTLGAPLPAQVAELGIFILSGCLFLAVGHQIKSQKQLAMLTWLFIGAGIITCVVQMIPALALAVGRWTTRPGSVGSLFWTWLVAVSLSQAIFNRNLSWPVRCCLLAINALVLYHGLFQARSWASGWVPVLATIGIILFFRLPRLSMGAGLLSIPVALALVAYLTTLLLGTEDYSLSTRMEASRVLWQLVERSPVLGTGPANYYYYTENFPILGWYVRFISHNNYQDLLVQTGMVGLLAFLWFSLEALLLSLRLFARLPAGFAKAYTVGVVGGLTGSLVSGMLGDWIIPFYYNAGILGFRSSLLFWVFLGGLLPIRRLVAGRLAVPLPANRPVIARNGHRNLAQVH